MPVGGKRPGAGRKKGVPNKLTKDLKEAILHAFDQVGGVDYLQKVAEEDQRTFCTLLGKVLPMQITGKDGENLNVTISIK
jgi:hypothetical protein